MGWLADRRAAADFAVDSALYVASELDEGEGGEALSVANETSADLHELRWHVRGGTARQFDRWMDETFVPVPGDGGGSDGW